MKKLITAILLSTALIASPASAMGVIPAFPSNAQIVAATQQACSFVPTASSITAIFAASKSWFTTAEAVASIICGAVTSTPAKQGVVAPGTAVSKTITIDGKSVTISGKFQ